MKRALWSLPVTALLVASGAVTSGAVADEVPPVPWGSHDVPVAKPWIPKVSGAKTCVVKIKTKHGHTTRTKTCHFYFRVSA